VAPWEGPALKRLLCDGEAGLIEVIVAYKIDRLCSRTSRSGRAGGANSARTGPACVRAFASTSRPSTASNRTAPDAEETPCRREAATRIANLERVRTFAFRRLNLLRAMAEVAGRAPNREAAIAAQLGLIRERIGRQNTDATTPRAVLERLSALAAYIDTEVRADPGAAASGDSCADLARFEDWCAERFVARLFAARVPAILGAGAEITAALAAALAPS
jgi:hypothetical protein